MAVIFNACSKSTQDRLFAANFGGESAEEEYTFITLIKTLGAIYSSINHAVLAQEEAQDSAVMEDSGTASGHH